MREIKVKVYPFAELSDAAKEKAISDAREMGFSWANEAMDSLRGLVKHFGGKLVDYNIQWDGCGSYTTFDMPKFSQTEIRRRLRALGSYNRRTGKGNGDCVLTGYCADENAIDGFRIAFRQGVRDLPALMQAAFKTWMVAVVADYAYEYSVEGFTETAEANEWEFYENGSFANVEPEFPQN